MSTILEANSFHNPIRCDDIASSAVAGYLSYISQTVFFGCADGFDNFFSASIGISPYNLHGIFVFASCIIDFVSDKFNITASAKTGKSSCRKIIHT